ncbi:MAG: 23S rRNA (uracil(1939)-C(5))-methyltransferase RlmD [Oscillospiraceae bacterium]|nr:23S rRNA (uracil(1939)-C(5))-methyltransferase RlmD [Oscillospiraceae bacterium]
MKKNDIFETEITGMTADGSGVCRVDGMAVFVPMTAVGDRLRVRIVKVLKRYAFGIVEELLTPGEGRCEPDCPVFRQCGGCVYRHVTYVTELRYKEQLVADAFTRIGGLHPKFDPILGAPARDGYRNKAQYPVAEADGQMICGFYARRSHRIVPYTGCRLQPPRFAEVTAYLLEWAKRCGITAYDESAHTGELRHIYLRQGHHSGEMLVCLVVRTSVRKKVTAHLDELTAQFPEIVSVTESVNPDRTNVILGKTLHTLAGKGTIEDTMCGVRVTLSPRSFYQVNTAQAERLYGIAREFAGTDGSGLLLDLYCGAGTIGLSMAADAGRLIGVEVVPEAVEDARRNAARAGVENASFFCGDAGTIAAQLRQEGTAPTVIVLDPPRKGCDRATLEAAAGMAPERIVMVSCEPSTAARDAAILEDFGYHAERVRAVDMFPGTGSVECVVRFMQEKERS